MNFTGNDYIQTKKMGADHSRAIVPDEDLLLPYKLNNTLGAFVEFTKQMTIPLEDENEETQEMIDQENSPSLSSCLSENNMSIEDFLL